MMNKTSLKCYLCKENIINGNTYNEHIILNAMGGKLKSKDLLCHTCGHSSVLEKADDQMAEEFKYIANLMNIKRDRGNVQPIEVREVDTGKKIYRDSNGNHRISTVSNPYTIDDNGGISITANSEKEAKQILRGLKRKYPELNIEEELKRATKTKKPLGKVCFSFDIIGDKIYRSACKTAVNFYVYSRKDHIYLERIIPYLKGEENLNCVQAYYPNHDFFPNLLEIDKVLHNLFIGGNSKDKVLYAVVQFFSTFQFLILISDEYNGEDFFDFYSFDLIKSVEYIPKKIDEITHLTKNQILEVLGRPPSTSKHSELRLYDLFKFILIESHIQEMTNQALKNISELHSEENDLQTSISEIINKVINDALDMLGNSDQNR